MKMILLFIFAVLNIKVAVAGGFPVIPARNLPSIRDIPTDVPVILEPRAHILPDGQPITSEIGVFNLSNGTESVWDVPPSMLRGRIEGASWSFGKRQLFLAHQDLLVLLGQNGIYSSVTLPVLGVSHQPNTRYEGMSEHAISLDGNRLAYTLYERYRNNSLYEDLMIQDLNGSEPRSIAADGFSFHPDWSPDGQEIAFVAGDDSLMVKSLKGDVTFSMSPLPKTDKAVANSKQYATISLIRWSPKGDKVAFIADRRLFVVEIRSDAKPELVLHNKSIEVVSFAWSPDGSKMTFRSSFEAGEDCNLDLGFLFNTSRMPCYSKFYLYTINSDGSDIKRISELAEYRPGALFWIQ